jgi:predicted O-methyltransferase YrrM
MILKQLINPFYVVGRLHLALWESRNPGLPWMSQGAIYFLEGFLRKSDVGIEFGSGRSTAWFGRHTRRLISIEHNKQWFEIVQKQLRDGGLTNVEYHHIPLDHPETEWQKIYDPLPRYVDVVNKYQDGYFDFVIVDGHYREPCVQFSIPKLKTGGILILDNSDWLTLEQWGIPDYLRILHRSKNVRSETTVFLKTAPAEGL